MRPRYPACIPMLFCAAVLSLSCRGVTERSATSKPATTRFVDPAAARWMESQLGTLGTRTLSQLTLPASHDSGMYNTGFPQSLARTQDLSLYGQLNAGIRYFDLRPRYRNGTLFIHHGPITGPALEDVLKDIRRFLLDGHRELILLKFSHYDGFSPQAYSSFAEQIRQTLGPWLYDTLPSGKRLCDIALGDYVQHGGRVLILCDGEYAIHQPVPEIWIYRDWDSPHPEVGDLRVYDQYSNTTDYHVMRADQLVKFQNHNGHCLHRPDVPCDLFLLSWTLTPTTDVPAYAAIANPKLAAEMSELKMPNRFGCRVNLLYLDCAESANLPEIASQLNQR